MMHWLDLLLTLVLIVAGCAVSYLLLSRRISRIVSERHLKIADQLAKLDDAIHALETRLAEHYSASELIVAAQNMAVAAGEQEDTQDAEGSEFITPETQAVIAAAAVAALGPDVHIRSIKPATSSWTQQGRVMVQGSHNARARR
jgi:hypothetical protein